MKGAACEAADIHELSGESVAEVMNFYKLDPDEEMIVIF